MLPMLFDLGYLYNRLKYHLNFDKDKPGLAHLKKKKLGGVELWKYCKRMPFGSFEGWDIRVTV